MPAPNWNGTDWIGTFGDVWDVDGVTPLIINQSGSPYYSDITYTPNGTWMVGYRPTSVTIDIYAPSGFYEDGVVSYFNIYQESGPTISVSLQNATFPLVVDTSSLTSDITYISFDDVHGWWNSIRHDVSITSVVFSGDSVGGGAGHFKVKVEGAYACALSVSHKANGAYSPIDSAYVKVGGVYQPVTCG